MRNAGVPLLGLLLMAVGAVTFTLAWDCPPKTRLRWIGEVIGATSAVIGLIVFAAALIWG